jgi:small-conductance mechanosensitive channel
MELLDRYLQAVKKHLPWERQDDIIAELRANLEAQLEDKEAELGRPLTKEEAEEWLKQIGSPIQVAARYQRQQFLIGPAIFPTYSYILRLVLAWATVIYAIANAVAIAASNLGGEGVLRAALRLPEIWLINAGVVTLIFVVIELTGARFPEKFHAFGPMTAPMTAPWSPLDLPPVGAGDGDWAKPRSFTRALLEVFFGCLFLAYLLLVPHYPFLLLGPGAWYLKALPYQLAPVWWTFYWLLVGLNAVELSWKIVDLARGAWQRPRNRARHLAMHALSLIPLGVLLAAPEHKLFLLKNPADAAVHGAALASANKGVLQALTIVVAIVVLQLVWGIVRASLDAYRKRLAA